MNLQHGVVLSSRSKIQDIAHSFCSRKNLHHTAIHRISNRNKKLLTNPPPTRPPKTYPLRDNTSPFATVTHALLLFTIRRKLVFSRGNSLNVNQIKRKLPTMNHMSIFRIFLSFRTGKFADKMTTGIWNLFMIHWHFKNFAECLPKTHFFLR